MPASVEELCREQRVSVAELVQQTGLEETRISAIILGRWTPSPVERAKIAKVFGLSASDISWGHKIPIQHLYGHGPGGQTS